MAFGAGELDCLAVLETAADLLVLLLAHLFQFSVIVGRDLLGVFFGFLDDYLAGHLGQLHLGVAHSGLTEYRQVLEIPVGCPH